ncbi:hypothetical protein O5O45_04160 [Hahella aquimaris]|uniref:hypothetical protein n=1 Tax=Hahella sp. HNIBRBA332 TaxID=3015983 RepID=UPI00273C79AD|nr:hypothetical protein [Hahella sp. HNIBRBA332]WLQ15123.1 hypothetical protein O5O45_04160 [Hahella sp. HNIBRBA332]
MIAEAHFSKSKRYYEEEYSQWLKHIDRWRKYAPLWAGFLFAAGAVLCAIGGVYLLSFGVVALIYGAGAFIVIPARKKRWLAHRMKSGKRVVDIKIRFYKDGIGFGSGDEKRWPESVLITETGMFVRMESYGQFIYIPEHAIQPAQAAEILGGIYT